ncbi:MAG TPA: haloacid dehalogenase type II [Terriglobales bacterium]|nr:haloacid dehalogenase type II [Terriglobales bacterium]
MLKSFDFDLLTFDCYGTLVDWETGIFAALKPVLATHGKSISDAELLEFYGEFEADAEAGAYQSYRNVLRSVVRNFGRRLQFTPTLDEAEALANSVGNWRPWSDTVSALQKLAKRYRLAIISNIDDDLFGITRLYLGVEFDQVTTAQQARCYKPGLKIFQMALEKAQVPPARILHVGQSIYHDVLPAQSLGLATVWVNRPSPRAGVGAVKNAQGSPDLEVPDLATLAQKAGC